MLKHLSLILALIGILSLSLILIYQKPIPISNQEQLEKLIPNQLVKVKGTVIEEKYTKTSKILILDNNLKIICGKSCPYYLYSEIQILGTYDEFYKQIKALKITGK